MQNGEDKVQKVQNGVDKRERASTDAKPRVKDQGRAVKKKQVRNIGGGCKKVKVINF